MPVNFWPFRRRREPVVISVTAQPDAQLAAAIQRMIRRGELDIKGMS